MNESTQPQRPASEGEPPPVSELRKILRFGHEHNTECEHGCLNDAVVVALAHIDRLTTELATASRMCEQHIALWTEDLEERRATLWELADSEKQGRLF